jgi:hypothetical protein
MQHMLSSTVVSRALKNGWNSSGDTAFFRLRLGIRRSEKEERYNKMIIGI